jgi:hypothetical protein
MNSFDPASLGSSIVTIIFYLLMATFAIYSLIAIYSLLRYGRSKTVGALVAVIYIVIVAGLYAAAQTSLNNL